MFRDFPPRPVVAVIALIVMLAATGRAAAGQLTICADPADLRIAHGSLTPGGWVTRGWVTIPAGRCEVLQVRMGEAIDINLVAFRAGETAPIRASRLPWQVEEGESGYMRDEKLVCVSQSNFESKGTYMVWTRDCPPDHAPMVLPMRITVPANTRYRLSM